MPDNYITLSQLTKTTKGLINKINAESIMIDSKIGDLTELETTISTDLVSAINELAEGSGGAGVTSFNGQTGAVTYTAPVTSVNGSTGAVTLTIPDAQVQSDWNATTGMGVILNKPTIPNVPSWALASSKPTYTASEVGALPSSTTYVSSFNGNTGAITYSAPVSSVNGQTGAVSLAIPAAQVQSDWDATTGVAAILNKPSIPTDISDLTDTNRIIPTIPETVSSFENDAGYLTSFTETDPTVPSWAKAVSKPTYTASEVGALPSSTTYVSSFNGDSGAITYTAPITSVNGTTGVVVVDKLKTTAMETNTEYNLIGTASSNNNTSAVNVYQQTPLSFAKTNSLSRLTIGSTATPGVIRLYTSASGASGYSEIKSNASSTNERTITLPDASGTVALTTDIPSISSWALASSKPSYTFSELTSHPTSLEGYGITDAYTKTEVDGLVSGVLHYKGTKATVSALPSSGNAVGDVWHVTADAGEYAWDGSTWQELGSNVDLSGYVPTSTTVNGKALTGNISLTASDVSALPSSTTYVSSFNGSSGAITYTAPVTSVNGQTGAVTLTIPAAISVTNTLQTGTLIATINGTNIYAPAYTDADGVGY